MIRAYPLKEYYKSGCPIEVVVGKVTKVYNFGITGNFFLYIYESGLKVNSKIAAAGYNIVDVRNVGYDGMYEPWVSNFYIELLNVIKQDSAQKLF